MFVSSSEDCQMIVWDLESRKSTKILTIHTAPINYMCLSPDGNQLLSASDDFTLKLWDVNTWEVICTFEGHADYVSKAAIAPGGLIVSVSKDQTVKVWDSNTGYCLHTLQGHNSWVYMLAVSPDGNKAITASVNGTMIVWDLISGARLNTIVDGGEDVTYVMGLILDHKNRSEKGHEEYPIAAKWLKDWRIITTASDIIIWDDKTFTELKRLKGDPWKIHDFVIFNHNNYLITVAHSIKGWNLETGEELFSEMGHEGEEIYSAAITFDEKYLLTGDKQGRIKIWDINALLNQKGITGHMSMALSIRISPDGTMAATGGFDKTAILWDTRTGIPIFRFGDHSEIDVIVLGFIKGGKELLTSSPGQICIWDTTTGSLIKKISHKNTLYTIDDFAILPTENQVFGGTLIYRPTLWDLETGAVEIYEVDYSFTSELVLSKNANYLLAGSYSTKLMNEGVDDEAHEEDPNKPEPIKGPVHLWDLIEKRLKCQYWFNDVSCLQKKDDKLYPSRVMFSPNEEEIIAGFSEGHLCIWERETGSLIRSIRAAEKYIVSLFLTSDGNICTKGQDSPKMRIWNLASLELIREIHLPGQTSEYVRLSINKKRLVVVSDKKDVHVLDLKNGNVLCSTTLKSDIRDLALFNNKIFVSTDEGLLYGFEI